MKPSDANRPVGRIRNLQVIFTNPMNRGGLWSLATFEWLDEGGEWEKVVGIRWDYNLDDDNDKGFPRAGWMVLPGGIDELALVFARSRKEALAPTAA